MSSEYDLILEEFLEDLNAMKDLINQSSAASGNPKLRVAACNSIILLIAATFEEFTRQMAKEYSKFELSNNSKYPEKMVNAVWQRTLNDLSKIKFKANLINNRVQGDDVERLAFDAIGKLQMAADFGNSNFDRDIHDKLVHNENNMRPVQFNDIFKIVNLSNFLNKICDVEIIRNYFQETNQTKNLESIKTKWEDFFEIRNRIAHSLNPGSSLGSAEVLGFIVFWEKVGEAIKESLNSIISNHLDEQRRVADERTAHEEARRVADEAR